MRPRIALDASFVISGICIVGSLIGAAWANGQHVNYGDLELGSYLRHYESGSPEGYGYYLTYLGLMFLAGVVALVLALVGARAASEKPWRGVVAGAMAMAVLAVPIVLVISYGVSHWSGYGGD